MVPSSVGPCGVLEVTVMLFQVAGVTALVLSRLLPSHRWGERARSGFVVAMVGLGIAGALCGRHDSEFSLFAGGTMTVLLIGMTMGGGSGDTSDEVARGVAPGARLAS